MEAFCEEDSVSEQAKLVLSLQRRLDRFQIVISKVVKIICINLVVLLFCGISTMANYFDDNISDITPMLPLICAFVICAGELAICQILFSLTQDNGEQDV